MTAKRFNTALKGYLILENGSFFEGNSFGAQKETEGEVVFHTGMTGYQEILSDPSYCDQLVTLTYPLIGNYGFSRHDFESFNPAVQGLIVKEYCSYPHHWRQDMTIDEFLQEKQIPGMYDVDTRQLTRMIRTHGALQGKLITGLKHRMTEADIQAYVQHLKHQLPERNQVQKVSTRNVFHCPGKGLRVVMVDYGAKAGLLRSLTKRQCDIHVVPYHTSAEDILKLRPDGVFLSSGPGDPQHIPETILEIQQLIGKVPLFGVCLGHQLIALANGAQTEKMKIGHRGANHPVRQRFSGHVFMTSQNHGYTVSKQSLVGTDLELIYEAVHDGTVEGLAHRHHPVLSVQFHPEAAPGPVDHEHVFDQFMQMMKKFRASQSAQDTNQHCQAKGEHSYATL